MLALRLVFHLALRQAEGFSASVLRLLGQELRVPDHTTLSRRSRGFARTAAQGHPARPHAPGDRQHGAGAVRPGRVGRGEARPGAPVLAQVALAVDANTGEIVACVLTDNGADDAGELPALLGQVEGEIASVTADGAYDGEPVYHAATSRQPDRPPDVVIPPRASAVASTEDADAQSQRDRHIRLIAEKGRMAWQKATGYGRRSHAETAVGRYKATIGPRLRARGLPAQQGEAAIAVEVLNRMIRVAKPVSVRAA